MTIPTPPYGITPDMHPDDRIAARDRWLAAQAEEQPQHDSPGVMDMSIDAAQAIHAIGVDVPVSGDESTWRMDKESRGAYRLRSLGVTLDAYQGPSRFTSYAGVWSTLSPEVCS